MNKLTELYKEIRRYGKILEDNNWSDQEIPSRHMVIDYEGCLYDIYLKNGDVKEISTYHN